MSRYSRVMDIIQPISQIIHQYFIYIHCYSSVMFLMMSISIENHEMNNDEIIIHHLYLNICSKHSYLKESQERHQIILKV